MNNSSSTARQAATTYGNIAKKTATQRELEANLLLRAASRLQAASDAPDCNSGDLDQALQFNRKLWAVLIAAVTRADNPLPVEIRQNVANLGLYVINQTVTFLTDPKPERLGSIIHINRELAAGLLGR